MMIIEFFKHALGICGDHWHPNIWTGIMSVPIIAPTVYYIKCKCGGLLKHKKDCKQNKDEQDKKD